MNKILKVFRYAGLALVFIALASLFICLLNAFSNYNDGSLTVELVETNLKHDIKLVEGAKFTNSNVGVYEFKPTLSQAIILSDDGIGEIGAATIFYLLLGIAILIIAYKKPTLLEEITESRLWQIVGAGGLLFLAIKFLSAFLLDKYVGELTHLKFKYYHASMGSFNMGLLSLILVLTIIYELLSYSRKLQEENDLTI